ncbi:MAG: hypothetical protein ABGX16_09740 [Pirellulales bacterium]
MHRIDSASPFHSLAVAISAFGRMVYALGTLTTENYGRDFRLTDIHGEVIQQALG